MCLKMWARCRTRRRRRWVSRAAASMSRSSARRPQTAFTRPFSIHRPLPRSARSHSASAPIRSCHCCPLSIARPSTNNFAPTIASRINIQPALPSLRSLQTAEIPIYRCTITSFHVLHGATFIPSLLSFIFIIIYVSSAHYRIHIKLVLPFHVSRSYIVFIVLFKASELAAFRDLLIVLSYSKQVNKLHSGIVSVDRGVPTTIRSFSGQSM